MNGWQSLGFKTYNDYLNSDIWKERKETMLSKYFRCQICNQPKRYSELVWTKNKKTGKFTRIRVYSGKILTVHHTNYQNVGNEVERDLQVLCYDCHKDIHKES